MILWLIQDGEKTGPFQDYEIRRQIEDGLLTADTPAWHEGLAQWQTLGEISLFGGEFQPKPSGTRHSPPDDLDCDSELDFGPPPRPGTRPPPLPSQLFLWRRFWARWFDLYAFGGIWWIIMWATGRNIETILNNPWLLLLPFVLWFLVESYLLHRYATTPGKWLLGIRVINDDGSHLSLAQGIRRSGRVFFMGVGLGWLPLTLACHALSVVVIKRMGRSLWDYSGGHDTNVDPLRPLRCIAFVAGFFVALQMQVMVVAPYAMESVAKSYPNLKEFIEKNQPWQLPRR